MSDNIIDKEAKKQERRQKKAAEALIRAAEEKASAEAWAKAYPARVKTYREKIKEAGFTEVLSVDSDLNISVSFQEEEMRVDRVRYAFPKYDKTLNPSSDEYEFSYMMRILQDYIDDRETHRKFLAEVKTFKDSLSKEQLKMIEYFSWVR